MSRVAPHPTPPPYHHHTTYTSTPPHPTTHPVQAAAAECRPALRAGLLHRAVGTAHLLPSCHGAPRRPRPPLSSARRPARRCTTRAGEPRFNMPQPRLGFQDGLIAGLSFRLQPPPLLDCTHRGSSCLLACSKSSDGYSLFSPLHICTGFWFHALQPVPPPSPACPHINLFLPV